MNELTFWEIIESNNSIRERLHQQAIIERNRFEKNDYELRVENVLRDFQERLNENMYNLFKPGIAQIFYLSVYQDDGSSKYISNDGFIDFRAWIVSLGKFHFEKFLYFEDEEEILEYDLNPNLAYRSDIPFLTSRILEDLKLDNKKSEIDYYFDGDYDLLMNDLNWERLKTKYPKIWDKYQLPRKNS